MTRSACQLCEPGALDLGERQTLWDILPGYTGPDCTGGHWGFCPLSSGGSSDFWGKSQSYTGGHMATSCGHGPCGGKTRRWGKGVAPEPLQAVFCETLNDNNNNKTVVRVGQVYFG